MGPRVPLSHSGNLGRLQLQAAEVFPSWMASASGGGETASVGTSSSSSPPLLPFFFSLPSVFWWRRKEETGQAPNVGETERGGADYIGAWLGFAGRLMTRQLARTQRTGPEFPGGKLLDAPLGIIGTLVAKGAVAWCKRGCGATWLPPGHGASSQGPWQVRWLAGEQGHAHRVRGRRKV